MSTTTHGNQPTAPTATIDERREDARHYIEQLRAFSIHAGVFVAGMVVIFVVNLSTNAAAGITGEWWAWWSAWALLGWGLAVGIHGLVVRMSRPQGSNPTWEEQQINKILSSADAESAR